MRVDLETAMSDPSIRPHSLASTDPDPEETAEWLAALASLHRSALPFRISI